VRHLSFQEDVTNSRQADSNDNNPCSVLIDESSPITHEVSDYAVVVEPDQPIVRKLAGRRKCNIWDKFRTIRNLHGAITINKCLRCGSEVSPRADRMRLHSNQCDGIEGSNQTKMSEEKRKFLYDESDQPKRSRVTYQQPKITQLHKINADERRVIDLQLGRFLFSSNLPFHVVKNKHFATFCRGLNSAYSLPSDDTVGTRILDAVYDEVRSKMESELLGQKVCILQDGWSTSQNAPVISHSLKSSSKSYFLSAESTGTEKKTSEFCFQLLEAAIKKAESEYGCNVVGVATDNCSSMTRMQSICSAAYPNLLIFGCNAHLFNLLGSYFTPKDAAENVTRVQKFMRGHQFSSAALKKLKSNRPVLPSTTRWNSQIDSFKNFLDNQGDYLRILREMKVSLGASDTSKIEEIIQIIRGFSLSEVIEKTMEVLEPISIALDKVSYRKLYLV
jgi:hypothetical protein